jgi:gluconolactonase
MAAAFPIWLVSVALGVGQEDSDPAAVDVIARGAKLEKVWGEGSFTEGGALDQDGSILFSDIGNRIMRFDPKAGQAAVFRQPSGRANGMVFDKLGQLIVAEGANTGGGRRVSITSRDGTVRTLADNYDGKRFNSPNDVAVDSFGRVYVSDPRYVGNEPRELDFEGVFMIESQGFVTPLITTALKPNGLALSPDEKTLYISDNGARRRVLIAARRAPNGRVGEPRVIHDFGAERGIDGMTVTTDGRIVAAAGSQGKAGVLVLSPQGKILATIPTPEDPANVEFGGRDGKTLYICAGKSLYRIQTTMVGYHLWPRVEPQK